MRLSDEMHAQSEPLSGVLTADDAVARAMRYNFDLRAKELERVVAEAKVRMQAGGMLPSIVAENSYYRRDQPMLSRSSGSPLYSGSTDLQTISRDISLSWNILDFGLSYVRSIQSLDKSYQAQEEVRRIRARISEDTVATYWRAVALMKLSPALKKLRLDVEDALRLSAKASADLQMDPMASINFQRETLNLQRDLDQLNLSLAGATDQLKHLIGQPNLESINLDATRRSMPRDGSIKSADADIADALLQRPEIRQAMYDLRISEMEVDATIIQVLPGATFGKSFSHDSNSFLLHSNWVSWSSHIAGNLISLVRLPADLDAVESQALVVRQNALATAATIAMQVHVARARLAVQIQAYADAQRFASAQKRLLDQVIASVKTGKVGQQAIVREKLASLLAEIRAYIAYADVQSAIAAYATARGDDAQGIKLKTSKLDKLQESVWLTQLSIQN